MFVFVELCWENEEIHLGHRLEALTEGKKGGTAKSFNVSRSPDSVYPDITEHHTPTKGDAQSKKESWHRNMFLVRFNAHVHGVVVLVRLKKADR